VAPEAGRFHTLRPGALEGSTICSSGKVSSRSSRALPDSGSLAATTTSTGAAKGASWGAGGRKDGRGASLEALAPAGGFPNSPGAFAAMISEAAGAGGGKTLGVIFSELAATTSSGATVSVRTCGGFCASESGSLTSG